MGKDDPEGLRPYLFHGLELSFTSSSKEATGDCPFCGKEAKFSINVKTSKFRCFVCGETGNAYDFVARLWEESAEQSTDTKILAKERGLQPSTLDVWGVCRSILTDEWLVPGCNTKGKVCQLYRYVKDAKGKMRLFATPTLAHGLHGTNFYNPKKPVVYLCEGPWDAMKLWETLSKYKEEGDKLVALKKPKQGGGLLRGANVLAVPGCTTFQDSWKDVFLKKKVYVVYDSDHPKKQPKTGKLLEPAGYQGVKRVAGRIGISAKSIGYLRWGPKGYDPKLPTGTDIRDYLGQGRSLGSLFSKIRDVPTSWLEGDKPKKKEIRPVPCDSWVKLSNTWKKALKWSTGLDTALSVMLASAVSTDLVGDQLWIKVIGPASCGKTTLAEAMNVAKRYVISKDTFTGLTSGFKGKGGQNLSLAEMLAGKTLIINDGDTLVNSPNLPQILSQLRAFYGRNIRTQYKNEMSRDFEGISTTVQICGTGSLRLLDTSELGERFLDCVIMEGIDDDMEDAVLRKVAERDDRNLKASANGMSQAGQDKLLEEAMALTGGYVQYLRQNDKQLMADVETPAEHLDRITRIGKFVALMRARPSKVQREGAEREFAARLVSQHVRLARCLAVVMNRRVVDDVVMDRVLKVARDTARGITLNICNEIREDKDNGDLEYLHVVLNNSRGDIREMLLFLKAIGVLRQWRKKQIGVKPKMKWRLTERCETLFDQVLG